jgi:hypothetical protein
MNKTIFGMQIAVFALIIIGMIFVNAQLNTIKDIAASAALASEKVVQLLEVDPTKLLELGEASEGGLGHASEGVADGINTIRDAWFKKQ